MPRCSCAGNACGCTIQAGDGLAITGTGNTGNPFTLSLASPVVNVTQAAAGALDLAAVPGGTILVITLNANVTSITLPQAAGMWIDIVAVQGTGGSKTITWPSAIKWPGGTNPVLSTTVGYHDWFRIRNIATGLWVGSSEGLAIR